MKIGQRLRQARQAARMSQHEIAAQMGVSIQAVSQWENDKTVPGSNRLLSLGTILGVDFLDTGSLPTEPGGRMFKAGKYVPLVSRVSAGDWHPAMAFESAVDMLTVQWTPKGPAFALEVHGESMMPEFRSGDIIIIDTSIEPLPGDFVVASLEGEHEATFKKFRPRGADDDGNPVIELVPLNPDYPTLTISSKSPGRIIGTMYEHRSFRRRIA